MYKKFDFIGKNIEYCNEILSINNIKANFIPYKSLKEENINAKKIIVRQRYKEDNTLELVYCMFS